LVVILSMLGLHWTSQHSSLFAYFSTILIAFLFFGVDGRIFSFSLIKSFFLSLFVLLIIWGAIFLNQITSRTDSVQIIGQFLSDLTAHDKQSTAILLGWLFPSFLQGLGGFGVPVAISAPILVAVGFAPIQSILITSIGHAWGITLDPWAVRLQLC